MWSKVLKSDEKLRESRTRTALRQSTRHRRSGKEWKESLGKSGRRGKKLPFFPKYLINLVNPLCMNDLQKIKFSNERGGLH